MLIITIGESNLSVPISAKIKIKYNNSGYELIINDQLISKNIKTTIKIEVSY